MTGRPDEAVTRPPSAGTGKPAATTGGRASAPARPGTAAPEAHGAEAATVAGPGEAEVADGADPGADSAAEAAGAPAVPASTGPADGVADTDAAAGTTATGDGNAPDPGADADATALAEEAEPPAHAVSGLHAAETVDGAEAADAAGIFAGSTGAADHTVETAGAGSAAAEPAGTDEAAAAGDSAAAEPAGTDEAAAAGDSAAAEPARADEAAAAGDSAAAEPAGTEAVDAGLAQAADSPERDLAGAADGAEGAAGPDTAGNPAAVAGPGAAGAAEAADDTMDGDGEAAAEAGQAVTGDDERRPGVYQLSNRYTLSERIAAGGMGEVWRGVDELLGRPVAVKLLNQKYAADEQFRARFRAEARYAASLSHAGIARVFDYGESDQELPSAAGRPVAASIASPHTLPGPPGEAHPAGVAYLVMELIEGEPLSAILAREGQLPVADTLDLIEQAAAALQAAHAAGIVHRDIKPGNMLITPDGRVKITDFGIARAVLAAPLTQTGMVIGTARYVSPEQATGAAVTVASDIYSLGVVGYECLAGEPPFTAEAPLALALAHVSRQPPPLPGSVPRPVAALIGQMLAKDPANRPAGAQAVAERARALRDDLAGADSPAVSRGRPGTPAATMVDLQGVADLATPAAWFSHSGMTSPAPSLAGTAPMRAKGGRRGRLRRSALSALIVIAVLTLLTAGAIAVISGSRNPAATAGPKHPSGRARTHRTGPSRQPVRVLPPAPTPAPTHQRPSSSSARPTTPEPSRSPTTSPSPSPSPDPSGTPTSTPPPTSTPTPTGTGSSSASLSQSPRQPTTQDG